MSEIPPNPANSKAQTTFVLQADAVQKAARQAGFSQAGLVALPYAEETLTGARFAEWIAAGHAGSMHYLERRTDQNELLRQRVQAPFAWARSAIVCFASYNSADARSTDAHERNAAWIARYAWSSRVDEHGVRRPSDYHKVLKKRLALVEANLRCEQARYQAQHQDQHQAPHQEQDQELKPEPGRGIAVAAPFEARGFVDTGPVLERALAVAAGLGWTGKNTCLIHPKLGSFGFLAVLLTSLKAAPQAALAQADRCGSCTRCLEACPTNALIAPRQMDATRCISYLTIEHKGAINLDLAAQMGRQVFGCDICQDVCPWNRKASVAPDAELEPRAELINPMLEELALLSEAEFEARFNGSPVRRAGYAGFQRNLAIGIGNSGEKLFAGRLKAWAESADEGLRSASKWAIKKLSENSTNQS